MKRLEIIHLRSSGEALDSLRDRIRDSIGTEAVDITSTRTNSRGGAVPGVSVKPLKLTTNQALGLEMLPNRAHALCPLSPDTAFLRACLQ